MPYIFFFLSSLAPPSSQLAVEYSRCVEDQAIAKLSTGEEANVLVAMGESRCASQMRAIEQQVRAEVSEKVQSSTNSGAVAPEAIASLVDEVALAEVNGIRGLVREAALRDVSLIRSKLIEDGVDVRELVTLPPGRSPQSKRNKSQTSVRKSGASTRKPEAIHDAAGICGRRFQSGEWIRPPLTNDEIQNTVTIKNGSDAAAVVKLVDTDEGTNWLFFVERNSNGTVGLNDGRYRIQYALGGRLAADCETVIEPSYAAQFEKDIVLRTERSQNGYSTSVVELTLYKVRGGNVATSKISASAFNKD